MYDYRIWKPMPPVMQAQDDELHKKQLEALNRFDFEEATSLVRQQTALRNDW
jgi:hypothetical protein